MDSKTDTRTKTGRTSAGGAIARLTYRGLLGRRRALLLVGLPLLLVVIAAVVRLSSGVDHEITVELMSGLALGTMAPLIGVITGTGAIGPEIDDGSIIYLLAKPVSRPRIVVIKLLVAMGVAVLFTAVPTTIAALVMSGTAQGIAVAFAVATVVAAVAYSALFLLLAVITRQAVVVGLIYALVWESLVGSVVPGAKTLSVQQWSLSVAQHIAADGTITSDVALSAAIPLLAVVTAGATWYAGRRLRCLTLASEE